MVPIDIEGMVNLLLTGGEMVAQEQDYHTETELKYALSLWTFVVIWTWVRE